MSHFMCNLCVPFLKDPSPIYFLFISGSPSLHFLELVKGAPILRLGLLYDLGCSMSQVALQAKPSHAPAHWAVLRVKSLYGLNHPMLRPIGYMTCHRLYESSFTPLQLSLN